MEDHPGSVVAQGAVPAARSTVTDVDGYQRSVSGIEIESVRAGPGDRPNTVMAIADDVVTTTSAAIGFPMLARTTIADDHLITAAITGTPNGSRWCEVDLEPGMVLAYGPGAEHAAANRPGLGFTFGIASLAGLRARAERLGVGIEPPLRGEVHVLAPTAGTERLLTSLSALGLRGVSGPAAPARALDDLVTAMTLALTGDELQQPIARCRGIDRRHVVNVCIDYADAIGRIPSISELCVVAKVTERRLSEAFSTEFGVPPTHFFRAWALEEAHRRLLRADPETETVTRIALDLGFSHLGRFAGRYKRLHGESPATTLRSEAIAATN